MVEIIKSPIDKRKYKGLVLKNKMKVVLISDNKITDGGCCMCVGVGTLQDGKVEGLAHFLEHMLFMGSKKYPDENHLMRFILNHDGYVNAMTSTDTTSYYFTISDKFLIEGLEIFSELFIEPLLKKDCIDREINAVNSEHMKNLNQNEWRIRSLIKSLSDKNKPLSKFSTGNTKTLKIDNIRNELIEFYNKYYSSNIMNLCVYGNQSIEKLEKEVVRIFERIKNKDVVIKSYGKFYNQLPQLCKCVSLSTDELKVIWELKNPRSIGNKFIAFMLNYIDEKTLSSILKKNELIMNMGCQTEDINDETFLFEIYFTPLSCNCKNKIDVYYKILEYLKDYLIFLRKSIKKSYYDELRTNLDINFFYEEPLRLDDLMIQITYDLHKKEKYMKLEKVLIDDLILNEYCDDIEKELYNGLEMLKLEESIIIMSSKSFKNECNLIDENYGIKYSIEYELPKLNDLEQTELNEFELPSENKYITRNIFVNELKEIDKPKISKNGITLYYNPKNNTPFVYVDVFIYNDYILKSKEAKINTTVFIRYLNILLSPINFKVGLSGGYVNVRYSGDCIIISFYGFETILNQLIDDVITKIFVEMTKELFIEAYTKTFTYISNTKNNPPYVKIEYFMDEMIEGGISRTEFLKRENVNLIEIKNYWDNLVSTKVICYIQGNINEDKSKIINNKFKKFVKNKYILTIDDMKIVKNVGEEVSFVGVNEYKYENNNVMAYVCQLGYEKIEDDDIWLNNHCCLYILNNILGELFFSKLRAKEQLGYIVKCYKLGVGYIQYPFLGYVFLVQTDKDKDFVFDRIKQFIKEAYEHLKKLNEKDYNAMFMSREKSLLNGFLDGIEEEGYYTNIIRRNHNIFDLNKKIAGYYKKMEKKNVIEYYKDKFIDGKYWKFTLESQIKNE